MASRRDARLRGLYAVTPRLADTEALCSRVAQCLAGGASPRCAAMRAPSSS